MKRISMPQVHLLRIAAQAPVTLLAACTLQVGLEPTTQTTAPAAPPALAAPSSAETEAQPPAADEWLLVNTEQGLWMSRPDGCQAGIRIPGRVILPGPLSRAISPDGGLFAYISTSADPSLPYGFYDPTRLFGSYPDLTLTIMSLSGAVPSVAIPLIPPGAEPSTEFTNPVQIAITEESSLAWSPDGKRLAFIGAQQGASADLYEYYLDDGRIARLTDGPMQSYRPLWSPDGAWIVHGEVSGFGTGAGYGVRGFYAARADGGGVFSLYEILERSGDEAAAGWLDGNTLIAHTRRQPCGPTHLRLVDLSAQKADVVFAGCMSDVAVGPGVVLFSQPPDMPLYAEEPPRPGVYLLTAADRTPRLLSGENIRKIEWEDGLGAFLAQTDDGRLLEVSPAGEIRALPVQAIRMATLSPDGRWWAATDALINTEGIFVGAYGTELRQIFEGRIAFGDGMLFSPAGDALYFVTAAGELFRAQAPNWAPAQLASGLTHAYGYSDLAWWEG
ncbi:MAG: PD40 domain-containing protein [Anaerolineales bacterium]|nr:PD40 domain-containing protein [Anaerolineales bacterium]